MWQWAVIVQLQGLHPGVFDGLPDQRLCRPRHLRHHRLHGARAECGGGGRGHGRSVSWVVAVLMVVVAMVNRQLGRYV